MSNMKLKLVNFKLVMQDPFLFITRWTFAIFILETENLSQL